MSTAGDGLTAVLGTPSAWLVGSAELTDAGASAALSSAMRRVRGVRRVKFILTKRKKKKVESQVKS